MRANVVMLIATVLACSCGGGSSDNGNPAGPSNSTPPPAGGDPPITISIVGDRGAQSFSPNPATIPAGRLVVWRNTDAVVHRVVLNDRSVDTGDIAPGASTAPRVIGGANAYHCSLHPSMVGSLNGATADPPQNPGEDVPY